MPGKRTEDLLKIDRKYIIHGFGVVGEEDIGPIIARAEGIKCWDTEGNFYYDAGSQQTSNTLGHGHKEIIEAICQQAQKLQFAHLLGKQSNVPIIEFARDLSKVVPKGLAHFFFTSGGSESVETAFKIARLYWAKQGRGKYKIISIENGYHGTGMGSAAATRAGGGAFWAGYGPLASGFIQAPYYYCNRCPFNLEYPKCKILCARYVEEIIRTEGPETVAAYIAEPVLGAAGNIAPPPEYFPIIRQICTDNDVLLIGDEVQTGFGRTGRMFAMEHWPVSWDMMTVAKAITGSYLPFGAALLSDRIYDGLKGSMLWHGWTQHGNPICAAAAKASLKLIQDRKLVENADKIGKYVVKRLKDEFKDVPIVDDISGLGLMLGIEVVKDKASRQPIDSAVLHKWQRELLFQKHLYVRPSFSKYYSRVRFNPPIITTRQEADAMLDILCTAMRSLGKK